MPAAGAVLSPLEALQQYWGYDTFRPMQADAIEAALAGRDSLLVLPTGGGKSLCYQTPAACGRGLVLIVSPLIALMDDQVAAARQAGLQAAALHSNLSDSERRTVREMAARCELQLLYVSPERLAGGDLVARLAAQLALIAIDEAHCVSHWGHDFRPEYRQLRTALDQSPQTPRMALTATATKQVQDDVVGQLGLRTPLRLVGYVDRPNLTYRALPRRQALDQVLAVVRRHQGEGGIIYAQTRKDVENLAEGLARHGVSCAAYHAGLPAAERSAVQANFLGERIDVVVATIAFGMGIDRSNVRYVVHASSPKSIENYQQEAGRAGRDGLAAECVLLYAGADAVKHRYLASLDGALPPERDRALERQLREIGRFAGTPVCRHRVLVEHFGQTFEAAGESCGACDVCLGEVQQLHSAEALIVAQKILSAVLRTGQRYGAGHVCQVLIGRGSDAVKRNKHEQLSVFGLLASDGEQAVRGWIDQLVVQGYLDVMEIDRYPILAVTDSGRALCRTRENGSNGVRLGRQESGRSSGRKAPVVRDGMFERLRSLRRIIAEQQGVPPYVVFTDVTLNEMAQRHPSDLFEMSMVRGVGAAKLDSYGTQFLDVLCGKTPEAAAARV
ncbi:MAG: ATP-dependent DNA helicase RecQ [Chloroflexi bacterium]|nr:ATP-dependent DNA helicase RecQ [Chloroflexota bacterium]